MPTLDEVVDEVVERAYEDVLEVFELQVELDEPAKTELQRMVRLTVGHRERLAPGTWSRKRFHNFIIGQAGRIASRCSTLAEEKGAGLAESPAPAVSQAILVAAGVEVMRNTHGILKERHGGCDVVEKDNHLTRLPGTTTESGHICPLWLGTVDGLQ